MREPTPHGLHHLRGAWTFFVVAATLGTLAGWTGRGYTDPIPNWVVATLAAIVLSINIGVGITIARSHYRHHNTHGHAP